MTDYDTLIIGAGIAGIQTAIDLGDAGRKVLMIEKQVSIGGTMIQLSKVFPTLDCASCITTPKMSSAFHHPQVDTKTLCTLKSFKELSDDTFEVDLLQKSRFIHMDKCTGCNECADVCPAIVFDDGYDENMGYKKAVGVPFATALPQKAALDIDNCILCGRCANTCPTEAIDFDMRDEIITLTVGSLVIATGFYETPTIKERFGGGRIKNVITAKQMERILAPTGPTQGIFRPSDGMKPWSIAFVQCAGSRDETIGVQYCSAICCMFAIKQAMLLSAAAPLADITIYYMDIRAFGKGHDEFFETAKAMGINFVKGKVARIEEMENQSVKFFVEVFGDDGQLEHFEHDLAILSMGVVPQFDTEMQKILPVSLNTDKFVREIRLNAEPGLTNIPGVFAVGTATGPKDIVDSIISGSAVAGKIGVWLDGGLRESFMMEEFQVIL
ncbi:MAG: CoB--CoM heterodisulfide reductase iron-sulfur subunit A family protein [Candidatus Heimdallarchaeota archaeon]|nr:CoB--CoM heterodisulfide reductase iron-sulfur subunit A family protein [Candidatus Heimdallarchaeota archaeon]